MKDYKLKLWDLRVLLHLGYTVDRGTGTPKDRVEFNRPEVSECDGLVCDFEVRRG
jgi:hypothetical protein